MSNIILVPRITEKTLLSAGKGLYTFTVPMSANKIEIARAAKTQFKVDATVVRISIMKGKTKKFRQVTGRRVDVKKAYVQVAPGQKISAFDLGQEDEKTDKKAKKADKKAEKQKAEKK